MSSIGIASIVFACVFGGALLGLLARRILPDDHLGPDSKDVVKLATGLIATMAALVLSLLISSAKGSFDKMNDELVQNASRVVLLDRLLAHYGPETKDIREQLKQLYTRRVDMLFSEDSRGADSAATMVAFEKLQDEMRALSPSSDAQRRLQSRALESSAEATSTGWLLLMQKEGSIPVPLLVILVFWLTIIFTTFGMFAPANGTVAMALLVCALSASGAIFLILEMERPLSGMVRISSAPMRAAITRLGQ